MKKMISIIMMICMLTVTTSVGAVIPPEDAVPVVPIESIVSESAEFYIEASKIPSGVLSVLSENGASVDDASVIEIISLNDSEDKAICVTNIIDDEIEKDLFISYVKDENDELIVDNSMAEILAQGPDGNWNASYPPLSWNGDYIVNATATAALYSDNWVTFYKPYKCSFSYINYAGVNIDAIDIFYIADGSLYTYPGFESTGDVYRHIVTASAQSPVEGRTYSGTNYFATNRVMLFSGLPSAGQGITFDIYIDGECDSYHVQL